MLSLSSLSDSSKNLCRANTALHVLVVTLPAAPPLGCVQDIESLRLLAESSGEEADVIVMSCDVTCGALMSINMFMIDQVVPWKL